MTTVGGLTPILLESSFQAQMLIPMATSIAFGEIFATILVLFLVLPYLLMKRQMLFPAAMSLACVATIVAYGAMVFVEREIHLAHALRRRHRVRRCEIEDQ